MFAETAGIISKYYRSNKPRLNRMLRESAWVVVGRILNIAGMLILLRLLTEYMAPSDYGQLVICLTFVQLTSQIITGGINIGITRFYPISIKNNEVGYFFSATLKLLSLTSIIIVLTAVIFTLLIYIFDLEKWLWGVAFLLSVYALFSGFERLISGLENVMRRRSIDTIHGCIDAWLKIPLAVFSLSWLGSSVISVCLAYCFCSIVVTASRFFFFIRSDGAKETLLNDFKIVRKWMKKIWDFSWPFSVWGIFTWLQQSSDRWAIGYFIDETAVAKYAVVFQIGYSSIVMVYGFLHTLIYPILYQRSEAVVTGTNRKLVTHNLMQIVKVGFILTLSGFVFTFLYHEWILSLLVGEEFRSFSYFLPWFVLASGLYNCGQMLSNEFEVNLDTTKLVPVKVSVALMTVAGNLVGAALHGIGGVIVCLIITSIIYFCWILLMVRKVNKYSVY